MSIGESKLLIRGKAEDFRKVCSYKSRIFGEECVRDECPNMVRNSETNAIGNYQRNVCNDTGDSITEYS